MSKSTPAPSQEAAFERITKERDALRVRLRELLDEAAEIREQLEKGDRQ